MSPRSRQVALVVLLLGSGATAAAASSFHTITACRVFDSRPGPPLSSEAAPQGVTIEGTCNVPAEATSIAANITITQPTATGYLVAADSSAAAIDPLALSAINFSTGQTRANNRILALAAGGGVFFHPRLAVAGTVHVILDVYGYFTDNTTPVVGGGPFSLTENSANATVVGSATVTDPDAGQTHTFAITAGNTAGAFAINTSTGQITVANSAALDFEANPSFNLTVEATDNGAPPATGSGTVVVNLTDANEPPAPSGGPFSIAENSANSTVVGTVVANDPDAGQTQTWAITAGNTGGAFAIDSSGQITVANSTAADFETNPTFNLTVEATDNGGTPLTGSTTVVVNVTNANEPPAPSGGPFSVAESSANGTSVGTVAANDPDAGQTHTWAITAGNTGGAFAINTTTGEVTVANSSAVDFETNPTFNLTAEATDNGAPNLSGSTTVVVNVTNDNEPPAPSGGPFSLDENSGNGTSVGTVPANDPDAGQTHTWAITAGNTGGAFAIDSSGQITVANSAAVDFDTTPTFNLTVEATDNGTPNLSGSTTVVVNLNNVNEAPAPSGGPFSIDENSANSTVIGTVAANDPDAGQTHTWAITAGNTGGAFAIDSSGQITIANSAALNFETTPTFNLTVEATDNGSPVLSGSTAVVVNVNNVNEAPAPSGGPFSIDENSANGTNVGTVAANDPDAGQTHTWAITAGNTGGAFAIDSSGQITVANSPALNFETTPTFNLTVEATDDGTPVLLGSTTVVVNVDNVNEPPAPAGGPFSIDENSANSTVVGTVAANDPDAGQTHTWAITAGNTGGAFAIDSSGQITVANSAALNFETTPTFNLTVEATDNGSPVLSGSASVTVNLNNVNEPPAPSGGPFSIDENSANSTVVGTVAANDPDAGQTHTWAITAGNTGGGFAIDSAGQITVANSAPLDFETTPTFNLTVEATDNGGTPLTGSTTVVVNLTNVNEPPTTNPDGADITEEAPNVAAANTVSGNVLTNDTDPDSSLTVSAVNGSAPAVGNPVAGTYGSVTINSNGSFTYTLDDTNPTVNALLPGGMLTDAFGYTASDGALTSSSTLTVTIHGADDPATPDNDAYDFVGNTQLLVQDSDTPGTPHVFVDGDNGIAPEDLLDGDVDPDGGSAITVSGIPGCADLTAPFDCVIAGEGTVSLNADGTFSFVPVAADPDPTATFQYALTGNPNPATVTLTRVDRIWYVDNSQPNGNGTSTSPLNTLTPLNNSGADSDVAGDTIFVDYGTGTSANQIGFELEAGQKLRGEFAGLSVPAVNGATAVLVPVPSATACGGGPCRPLIDGNGLGGPEGTAVRAGDVLPVEVVGVSLNAPAGLGQGFKWLPGTGVTGTGTFLLGDNAFRGGNPDSFIVHTNGSANLTLRIEDNVWIAGAHVTRGIDVSRSTSGTGTVRVEVDGNLNVLGNTGGMSFTGGDLGEMYVTSFAGNQISGDTAAFGVLFGGNVTLDADPSTPGFDQVSGGTTAIGSSGNRLTGNQFGGIAFASAGGSIKFTDLDVFVDGGPAFSVTNASIPAGGLSVAVDPPGSGGSSTLDSSGGAAAEVNVGVALDLQLAQLVSASSSTAGGFSGKGVYLNGVSGTFSAPAGSITGATNEDVHIFGGIANVTYGGTITDDAGTLVRVASATAGTKSFTGAISDGPTASTGSGISLTNNSGAITFSGGLALSTGANPAFTATGGGIVNVSGTNNITTTSGTGINWNGPTSSSAVTFNNVTSTTGAAVVIANSGATDFTFNDVTSTTGTAVNVGTATGDFVFHAINANGASKGIQVSAATGTFTVNGTGTTDGSGGTIQNCTQRGAEIISSSNVTLKNMSFSNNGTAASGSDDGNCSLNTGLNTNCHAGIHLQSVTTAELLNLDVVDGNQIGINGMVVSGLTVQASNILRNGDESGEAGLQMEGLSGTNAIGGNVFTDNSGHQVELLNYATAGSPTITVDNNQFSFTSFPSALQNGTTPPAGITSQALFAQQFTTGTTTIHITDNQFTRIWSFGLQLDINNGGNMLANIGIQADRSTSAPNTFTNCGLGPTISGASSGTMNFYIAGNTATNDTLVTGTAATTPIVASRSAGSSGNWTGQVRNNVIGTPGTVASGCAVAACGGIELNNLGASGFYYMEVTDNEVNHVSGSAIAVFHNSGSTVAGGQTSVVITHNTLQNPDSAQGNGIRVVNGDGINDLGQMCMEVGGSTAALKNTVSGTWGIGTNDDSIRFQRRTSASGGGSFKIRNYAPDASPTDAEAVAFVATQNTFGAGTVDQAGSSGNTALEQFVGGSTACPSPP